MAEDISGTRPSGAALLAREPITQEEQAAVARYEAAVAALAAFEAAYPSPADFATYARLNRLRMAVTSTTTKLTNLARGLTEAALKKARQKRWLETQRSRLGWQEFKRSYMRAYRAKKRFLAAQRRGER